MNETDRDTATRTWPPPQLAHEKGNDEKTVIVQVSDDLLQLLQGPSSRAVDKPAHDRKESTE